VLNNYSKLPFASFLYYSRVRFTTAWALNSLFNNLA